MTRASVVHTVHCGGQLQVHLHWQGPGADTDSDGDQGRQQWLEPTLGSLVAAEALAVSMLFHACMLCLWACTPQQAGDRVWAAGVHVHKHRV